MQPMAIALEFGQLSGVDFPLATGERTRAGVRTATAVAVCGACDWQPVANRTEMARAFASIQADDPTGRFLPIAHGPRVTFCSFMPYE